MAYKFLRTPSIHGIRCIFFIFILKMLNIKQDISSCCPRNLAVLVINGIMNLQLQIWGASLPGKKIRLYWFQNHLFHRRKSTRLTCSTSYNYQKIASFPQSREEIKRTCEREREREDPNRQFSFWWKSVLCLPFHHRTVMRKPMALWNSKQALQISFRSFIYLKI